MRTLYLRNVPDDVAERLEAMAHEEHLSLNALAVRELTDVARRAGRDNADVLADSPSHSIPTERIVRAIDDTRR